MAHEERVGWRQTIAAHLLVHQEADAPIGALTDTCFYLVKALLGIGQDEMWSLYGSLMKHSPRGIIAADPLLDQGLLRYSRTSHRNLDKLFVTKTTNLSSVRAFCQTLKDGRNSIDIWLGATAVCGAIALVVAQYQHTQRQSEPGKRKAELKRLYRCITWLNRHVLAWYSTPAISDGQFLPPYIFFESVYQAGISRSCVAAARNMFLSAVFFILYHELGHHFLGHLSARSLNSLPPSTLRDQELDADADAIRILSKASGTALDIGPIIVFVAASFLSTKADDVHSDTHPSLIDRMNHHATIVSEIHSREEVIDWALALTRPVLRTLFANIMDRDRFPTWFGQTRDEWVASLSKEEYLGRSGRLPEPVYPLAFTINIGSGPQPPATRPLKIDLI
jgi:hypothetical protein